MEIIGEREESGMFLENPVMAFCSGLIVALIGYHIYFLVQIKKEQERWFLFGVRMEQAVKLMEEEGINLFKD